MSIEEKNIYPLPFFSVKKGFLDYSSIDNNKLCNSTLIYMT